MARRRVVIEDDPARSWGRDNFRRTRYGERIIRLIADGYDTIGIAEQLGVSRWIVKDEVKSLCTQYGCRMIDLPAKAGMKQDR